MYIFYGWPISKGCTDLVWRCQNVGKNLIGIIYGWFVCIKINAISVRLSVCPFLTPLPVNQFWSQAYLWIFTWRKYSEHFKVKMWKLNSLWCYVYHILKNVFLNRILKKCPSEHDATYVSFQTDSSKCPLEHFCHKIAPDRPHTQRANIGAGGARLWELSKRFHFFRTNLEIGTSCSWWSL